VVALNYDVCWRETDEVVVRKQQVGNAGYYYDVHVPDDDHFAEIFSAGITDGYAIWDAERSHWVIQVEGRSLIKEAQVYWKTQNTPGGPAYAMADFLLDAQFDVVGYEECHRLRGAQTRVSKFAHRLSASIPIRIGLSGTPFP
jgi:hypothetical protein